MGYVSLSKTNRLFWLGRYSERVYTTIAYMIQRYDELIDSSELFDYTSYCVRLGIPCIYSDVEDFCRRYLFDKGDGNSIITSADHMLGNGMTLRETIHSTTLAYLQMACTAVELANTSSSPCVELQWALDDIMAFRGSFDDTVDDEETRNITKCGAALERLNLYLRFSYPRDTVHRQLCRLVNRLYKTSLTTRPEALAVLTDCLHGSGEIDEKTLLNGVETLFIL
ncbi:MAG: hypothetical protein H6Q60_1180 [Oscillospiraceae bacterium]|nr:hypothetical protein [Oscillospiraceae bacterium]